MPRYRVEYIEHRHYAAFVEAESDSAARQSYIDGDFDGKPGEVAERGYELLRCDPVRRQEN